MKTIPALKSCDGVTEDDINLFKKHYDPRQKGTLQKSLEYILCGKTEEQAIKILEDFLDSDRLNGRAKFAGEKIKEKFKIMRFRDGEKKEDETAEKEDEKEDEPAEKEDEKEDKQAEPEDERLEEKAEKEEKGKIRGDDVDEIYIYPSLQNLKTGVGDITFASGELRGVVKNVRDSIEQMKLDHEKRINAMQDQHKNSSDILNKMIDDNKEQIAQIGQLTPANDLKRVSIINPHVMLPLDIQRDKVNAAVALMRQSYR